VVFAHPLARSAIVAAAGAAGRRDVQLALAATTDDPDERVTLHVAAADGPDAALAVDLDAAAVRAADRGDLHVALGLARRAVELTPDRDVDDRVERLLTAAELASSGGDGFLPVELAEAAEVLSDDIEVRFRAGVTKFLTIGNRGDNETAIALADELLRGLTDHPAKRARINDLRAQALLRNDIPSALAAAAAAVDAAIEAGDDHTVQRERALWTMICVLAGRPVDLDAAERTARSLPDDTIAKDWLADVLSFCDRSAESLDISTGQLEHYQRLGLVHFEAPVRSRMIGDLIELGRYTDAIRQAEVWFDLQGMIGGVPSSTLRADIAYVHALRGDTDRALRELATAQADRSVTIDELSVASRGCQLHVVLERWHDAADRAAHARVLAARIGYRGIGPAPFRADAVEALVHLRRFDEARDLADELAEIAGGNREPRGAGDVGRAEALLAAAAGDLPGAVERWRTAVDVFTGIALPLELGQAQVGLGSTLRRLGKRAEAAERLAAARHTFESIGAPLLVARVDAEVQRLGARRVTGGTELTPTERQVVELVVAGRSNADIAAALVVSVRTVESNLTRAYRKLGVKSRTELAAAYRRQPA
jgi:DNA-binding CsgD family transcriptional regulator